MISTAIVQPPPKRRRVDSVISFCPSRSPVQVATISNFPYDGKLCACLDALTHVHLWLFQVALWQWNQQCRNCLMPEVRRISKTLQTSKTHSLEPLLKQLRPQIQVIATRIDSDHPDQAISDKLYRLLDSYERMIDKMEETAGLMHKHKLYLGKLIGKVGSTNSGRLMELQSLLREVEQQGSCWISANRQRELFLELKNDIEAKIGLRYKATLSGYLPAGGPQSNL